MKLSDFKMGDIVVIHTRNDDGTIRYKLLQRSYPINLVSMVEKNDVTFRDNRNGLRSYNGKEILGCFINEHCELREATDREKFLYHIQGPFIMEKDND